jgi:L-lactate dehydrogenase complex protein LldG
MTSRERILASIKKNQPGATEKPDINIDYTVPANPIEKFKNTLISIGGAALEINDISEIQSFITNQFPFASEIITGFPKLSFQKTAITEKNQPHLLHHIEIAILKGEFGVAENGAVWITQETMLDPALPFICENLILVINATDIIPSMHEAYERTDKAQYNFGTFIAGPSKTADIEQSLVLGAHGAKTLTVFIING